MTSICAKLGTNLINILINILTLQTTKQSRPAFSAYPVHHKHAKLCNYVY